MSKDITELSDTELNWIWCGVITELAFCRSWAKSEIIAEARRRGWDAEPNRRTRRLMAQWYREGVVKLQRAVDEERSGARA